MTPPIKLTTFADPERDQPAEDTARALIYLRVSTKEQATAGGEAEGYSIPAQRDACRRKAQQLQAEVVEEFVDAGESARSADRPDLQRLLAYVAENPVHYLIVHKIDRLARNRADDVMINLQLQQAGVRLVSCSENIDETPSGKLLHGIMASIAEFYSRNLGTEALKGMQQKAQRGGTNGKAPIGYRNVGKVVEGREIRTVELDPEQAPLVAWAFEAYATGDWTLKTLQLELTERGLRSSAGPTRTPKPLALSRLHVMLRNRYYLGKVQFKGVEYEGDHPPLVSDVETFNAVQAMLDSKRAGEKERTHNHYLRGTVFCGMCGSRLCITRAQNRHGNEYFYFFCVGRHQRRNDCQMRYVLVSEVERLVAEEWRDVYLDARYGALLQELVDHDFKKLHESNERTERRVTAQLRSKRDKRKKLLDAYYAGALPIDLLKSEQIAITKDIEDLEMKLVRTRLKVANLETALRHTLEFLYDPETTYLNAPPMLRRQLNQAVFERILVDEGPEASSELAEPFATVLKPDLIVPADAKEPPVAQMHAGMPVWLHRHPAWRARNRKRRSVTTPALAPAGPGVRKTFLWLPVRSCIPASSQPRPSF